MTFFVILSDKPRYFPVILTVTFGNCFGNRRFPAVPHYFPIILMDRRR
jgi:hypothetical protein